MNTVNCAYFPLDNIQHQKLFCFFFLSEGAIFFVSVHIFSACLPIFSSKHSVVDINTNQQNVINFIPRVRWIFITTYQFLLIWKHFFFFYHPQTSNTKVYSSFAFKSIPLLSFFFDNPGICRGILMLSFISDMPCSLSNQKYYSPTKTSHKAELS